MNRASTVQRHVPDRMTWIVGLGSTLGFASQTAGFWIVGAFVHAGRMDILQASLLSTAEMMAIGVVTLALAPVIHRVPHKSTMMLALLLALITQALSAVLPGYIPVLLARIGSGIAFGTIYAVATALGASAKRPQEAYAAAGSISLAIGTVWNTGVGYATEHYGYVGVFVALSIYCLVVAIPLMFIPFNVDSPARPSEAPALLAAEREPLRWQPIGGVMLIMALFAITTNGVYIFIERIGERVGLSGTQLGYGLTITSLVSALGVMGLGWIGRYTTRMIARKRPAPLSRALPLSLSMIAIGIASWAFMVSPSAAYMFVSLTIWLILYWAAYSNILEMAVVADPRGRVASATGSTLILLGGAGSALAGLMAKHFGMQSFGIVAWLGCATGAVFAFLISRTLQARMSTQS